MGTGLEQRCNGRRCSSVSAGRGFTLENINQDPLTLPHGRGRYGALVTELPPWEHLLSGDWLPVPDGAGDPVAAATETIGHAERALRPGAWTPDTEDVAAAKRVLSWMRAVPDLPAVKTIGLASTPC